MNKLTHNAQAMFDLIDEASNSSDLAAGNIDAVGHFGRLLEGKYTPEQLDDVQAVTVYDSDSSPSYVAGYMHMWDTLYNEIFDALA